MGKNLKYEMSLNESIAGYSIAAAKKILGDTYVGTVSLDIKRIISSGGTFQFRYGTTIDINNPDFKTLKERITKRGIDVSEPRIVVVRMIENGEEVFYVFDGHHRLCILKDLKVKNVVVDIVDLSDIDIEQEKFLQAELNETDYKLGNSFKDMLKNLHIVAQLGFNHVLYEEDKDYKKKENIRLSKLIKKWKARFSWYESPSVTLNHLLKLLFSSEDGGQLIIRPVLKGDGDNSWNEFCMGNNKYFPGFKLPGTMGDDYYIVKDAKSCRDVLKTIDRHNKQFGKKVRRIYLAPKDFYLNEDEAWKARDKLLEIYYKALALHMNEQIQYDEGYGVEPDELIRRRKKYYVMDGFLPTIVGVEKYLMDENGKHYEY